MDHPTSTLWGHQTRWFRLIAQEEGYGLYVMTRTAFVSPACENISPEDDEIVDELEEGKNIGGNGCVDIVWIWIMASIYSSVRLPLCFQKLLTVNAICETPIRSNYSFPVYLVLKLQLDNITLRYVIIRWHHWLMVIQS